MSTQFFLDETDIEALTKLMLRSQQLRTREALCIRIGIDPRRLGAYTPSYIGKKRCFAVTINDRVKNGLDDGARSMRSL